MRIFKLYAGMGGGYGEAEYMETCEYNDIGAEEAAERDAWQLAFQEFESSQEYPSWDDFVHDVGEEDATDNNFNEYVNQEAESWITYHVEEVFT